MRMSESNPSAARRSAGGRLKLPVGISALASLWLWFGCVASVRQESTRLQVRIEEARSVVAAIHDQQVRLLELEQRLPVAELELRTLSRMLWPGKGSASVLAHIDRAARGTGVRIETFSAAGGHEPSGSASHWKCDLEASFRPLLVFLRKMAASERIVHLRSLTIRPALARDPGSPRNRASARDLASVRDRRPRRLQLSLHLTTPSASDIVP